VSGEVAGSKTGRKRAVTRAIKEVAHYLGNTPAVCRASYIDPRVFDAYQGGLVIGRPLYEAADVGDEGELPIHQRAIEEAVLDLLNERERSRALERVAA
jgi:DNA topoisomerase-1